jgi:hypothetical protein
MLARGAALAGSANGANGVAAGAYSASRLRVVSPRNWRSTRSQLARQPRVRRLVMPRRIRPRPRS